MSAISERAFSGVFNFNFFFVCLGGIGVALFVLVVVDLYNEQCVIWIELNTQCYSTSSRPIISAFQNA